VTNGDGTETTTLTFPATSFDNWNSQEVDTYDTSGRLTSRVFKPSSNPGENVTTSFGYDNNGNLVSSTDGRGNTTTFCYDVDYSGAAIPGSVGNMTRTIGPPPTSGAAVPVTLYKYDAKNNLLETIPPKGLARAPPSPARRI